MSKRLLNNSLKNGYFFTFFCGGLFGDGAVDCLGMGLSKMLVSKGISLENTFIEILVTDTPKQILLMRVNTIILFILFICGDFFLSKGLRVRHCACQPKLCLYTRYSLSNIQKQPLRRFFNISGIFFQKQPFYNFPRGSICSSNRHVFSRSMFFEQRRIFLKGLSNRHVFLRRVYLFVEQTLLSHRTDTNFPRNPYLVLNTYKFSRRLYFLIERISIFQKPLYFSHRTDIHFPGSPI